MTTPKQEIHNLFNAKVADTNLRYEFNLFDQSVDQKLWSTKYYFDLLKQLDINTYRIQPSASTTQSTIEAITSPASPLDIEIYCKDLNRILDGFFMNSMSVLDTLAHQIWILYCFAQKEDRKRAPDVYISTINKDMLDESHSNSDVKALLDRRLRQDWFTEFAPFRHCTTHESFVLPEINPRYDSVNQKWLHPEIPLPDNPQVRPYKYDKHREANSFCKLIFDEIHALVNEIYEAILRDIRKTNNSVLPIPRSP
jgi:hypothetical protein